MKLVLTCEHAGNAIPSDYATYFKNASQDLKSHKGLDLGSEDLFIYLEELAYYSKKSTSSRLLIELNRSIQHPKLFSKYSIKLNEELKNQLIKYYSAYRNEIENIIDELIKKGEEVIHLSIHSFTPVLHGKIRQADIAALYDPSRQLELVFWNALKKKMKQKNPWHKYRSNYPYKGISDGLTTYFRSKFPLNYAGIELEINQRFSVNNRMDGEVKKLIKQSLKELMSNQ